MINYALSPDKATCGRYSTVFIQLFVGAEWTLNCVCLRTNVWFAAGQALVAARTGEADRLLSLDLSSLGDGIQLS
jgi:hypothetical protein